MGEVIDEFNGNYKLMKSQDASARYTFKALHLDDKRFGTYIGERTDVYSGVHGPYKAIDIFLFDDGLYAVQNPRECTIELVGV